MGQQDVNQDVNLDAGNSFSAFAHKINQTSYQNSPYVTIRESAIGGFRSSKGFRVKGLPNDIWLTAGMDGIGTKVLITDAAKMYETSAADLIAMICGDITRKGGLPLLIMNVLNVASLETPELVNAAKKLMTGLGHYAKEQNLVLFNGETAELKGLALADSNPTFSYLWESAGIGVFRESTEITGETIRPGQVIIAFQDKSPGSNGITELRRGLVKIHGEEWWKHPTSESDITSAAMPCTLYDKFLTHMNGWYSDDFQPIIKMHGIAHISGGGIPDKLAGDLLFSQGYGADLNNLFDPPAIFQKVAKAREGDFPAMASHTYLKRLHDMWHSGQRLLAIVDEKDANQCIQYAKDFGLDAQQAGVVTDFPFLRIVSKYEMYKNTEIFYTPEDLVRD